MTEIVTVSRERLPTHPGSYGLPWQAQPSFFAAIEIELPDGGVLTSLEVERIMEKPRTHSAFMNRYPLHPGNGKVLYWSEWLRWQQSRDPLNEDPLEADAVKVRINRERRGPGISRRR